MFETNTASCGGFAGISDTYGAALWGIDYGMQPTYGNFTNGLFDKMRFIMSVSVEITRIFLSS